MTNELRKVVLAAAIITLLASCRTSSPPVVADSPELQHDLTDAVAWTQTAAEANALRRQTFAVAKEALDLALADPTWTAADEQTGEFAGLPPAIVFDVDETILDNAPLEARFVRQGQAFSIDLWREWVDERNAQPLPGAIEFVNYATSRGVAIYYITNRDEVEEAATRDNLVKVGFPVPKEVDVVLTRGENGSTSDKSGRRALVAETHRIILMFGDDLGDFTSREGTIEDRLQRVVKYDARWGRSWFVLPNPMYGSWERAIAAGAAPGLSDHARKVGALDDARD